MRTNFILLVLAAALLTACKKENPEPANELIFGKHYGMCADDCFTVFSLDDEKVQQDTTVDYLFGYQNYDFTGSITLHDSLYDQVSHLLGEIPEELLTSVDRVYGCPDCHDQGGVYIEINRNGNRKRFNIDNDNTSDQSQEILDFKIRIHQAIELLD